MTQMMNTRSGLFDFSAFPILETERLILRRMTHADADAVFAIFGDEETSKYFVDQDFQPYRTRAEATRAVIDWSSGCFEKKSGLRWGVTLKGGDDTVIGTAGYNYWDQKNRCGEIGYDLLYAQWGKGLMTETIHALLRWGFEHMGLNRVEADVTEGNMASIRVLEKCGFAHEGTRRKRFFHDGRYLDHLFFGVLRLDYAAQFGVQFPGQVH